ncbi:hypothetical protein DRN85_06680 [Methanosarcinales archaeon]|nr:MAG: hypothetical protein DRN85_06680 [Methanosarcinales archaeon]
MIKAGCPEEICKKCGKARERITKTEYFAKKIIPSTAERDKGSGRNWAGERFNAEHYTIGWSDCGCNAGWRPGIVLDPFMGSGTTALVALKLNRRFIGFELNPEYVKLAYKRIEPYLNQSRLSEFLEEEI